MSNTVTAQGATTETVYGSETARRNAIYKKYILNSIDFSGYDIPEPKTDKEKLTEVVKTFYSEYLKNHQNWIKYYGSTQNAFKEWLMGLPSSINIDFENYRIIELSKEWGVLPGDATEKQEDKILSNWFNFMAAKFFQLCAKEKINVYDIIKF